MIAFYSGSFDPPTLGHYNIVEKAINIFEHVVVGIGIHPTKKPLFSAESRLQFIKEYICSGLPCSSGASAMHYSCTTVSAAKSVGASILIRGLRSGNDLAYELDTARVNRALGMETILMFPDDKFILTSSSYIRNIAEFVPSDDLGIHLNGLVTADVLAALQKIKDQK